MPSNSLMKMHKLDSYSAVALLVLCFAGLATAQTAELRPRFPNLTLNTIDGREWSLSNNKGSIVVLNFWATWCQPCRTEMPMLIKIADKFEKRGLQVVGVAVDEGGPELIKKFVAEYKIDYPILIPPEDSPWSRAEKMPTTLLIDSDGRLAGKYFGAVPEKVLREDIEKLIREKPEKGTEDAPPSQEK
jgi:thiol-disulfide isomerase/thioredoxin